MIRRIYIWRKALSPLNLNWFTTNLYRHNSFLTFTIYKKYLIDFMIELSIIRMRFFKLNNIQQNTILRI
jgi:hypothetical protein